MQINLRDDGAVLRKQFTRSEYFVRSPLSLSSLSLPPFISASSFHGRSTGFNDELESQKRTICFPCSRLISLFSPFLFFITFPATTFFRINTPVPKVRSTLSTVTSQCRWREVVPRPFSLPSSLPPVPRQFPSQYAVANF